MKVRPYGIFYYEKHGGRWLHRRRIQTLKMHRGRMRGNRYKQDIFHLDVRKKLFPVRMVKHWDRCPKRLLDLHPWSYSKLD